MKRILSLALLCLLVGFVVVAQDVPKADVFLGYSFLRVNTSSTVPAFTMNGGLGTLGLNINNHFGIEAEFGGYHNGNINNHQLDTTAFTYLFGPRLSVGRSKKFDPYIHALFGGIRGTTSVFVAPTTGTGTTTGGSRVGVSQANYAMAFGGGIDLRLSKLFTLRAMQLDYLMTRFETPSPSNPTGPTSNKNNHDLRFAAGVVFNFGGEKQLPAPEPPKMKNCPGGVTVPANQDCPMKDFGLGLRPDKTQVCQGETVMIRPAISIPDGATANWTINGEPTSQAPALEFGTTGRNPGSYKVALKTSAAGFNDGSAETTITVLEYRPPSGTLQVSPAEIWAGDSANLVANFSPGQCGGTLRPPSFTATEGSVSGTTFDSSSVQFDPSNKAEQTKTVTITANVGDEKGAGMAQATVLVKKKGVAAAQRLPDIIFPAGSARVNNCGKRVLLETLKTMVNGDPTATVVLVGHQAGSEKAAGLDQKRALNAAAVISAGQGICSSVPASQVQVSARGSEDNGVDYQPQFCGTSAQERPGQGVGESDANAKFRRVEVWFVPSGAALPSTLRDNKDAGSLNVSSLGCPR